jgi:hypothetical protein
MWDDLFSARATRQPDLNTCHQPLKAYLLGKGALNDTFETHKQLICYLLSAICHRAESALPNAGPDLAAVVHDADLARSKKVGNSSDRFLLSVRI